MPKLYGRGPYGLGDYGMGFALRAAPGTYVFTGGNIGYSFLPIWTVSAPLTTTWTPQPDGTSPWQIQ